jgi:hypothetical protein
MSAIAASFTDKSEPKSVISNGVKVNGEKYMTIEASDDSLKAKKVRSHSQQYSAPPQYHLRYSPTISKTHSRQLADAMKTGQGRRRSLQDNPGAPYCAPPRRHPDTQRLQQRRRAGRIPQEGRILSVATFNGGLCTELVHILGIFAYSVADEHDWGGSSETSRRKS